MLPLSIIRFFATLLSLLVLAAAVYLLWSWAEGRLLYDAAGEDIREHERWRLWTGLALLAWSFLGRSPMLLILARRDGRPTKAKRRNGEMISGVTGSSLYLEQLGALGAPPIIFTHGWSLDTTFWTFAKQDLEDRFRLICWDLPGLGRSRPGPAGVGLEAFADDLAGLVQQSGRRKVVLVGHSIGGMTIQTALRDNPQLHRSLAGIILLNTTYTNPAETMVWSDLARALQKPVIEPMLRLSIVLAPLIWLSKWQSYLSGSAHLANRFGFGRRVTRGQLEHVTLLTTRSPPVAEARGNLAMLNWDATEALGGSPTPVLVIGGDKDIVTKLEASRDIVSQAGKAELAVVEGANHLGPMDQAEVYNRLIADFALRVHTPDDRLSEPPDQSLLARRRYTLDDRPPAER